MLTKFFVIAILTALVKSENVFDEIGWICPSIQQWGNCSYPPNVPQLLRTMLADSNDNRHDDIYFCPYNIVRRHALCIETFYENCYEQLPSMVKDFFTNNFLKTDEQPFFCTIDRAYKKEFKVHMDCVKDLINSDGQIILPPGQLQQLEIFLEQDMIKFNRMKQEELKNDMIEGIGILHFRFDQMKCQYFKQYLRYQYTQIRLKCGSKTEKFFRPLLGNIWPMSSVIPKNCDRDLFPTLS